MFIRPISLDKDKLTLSDKDELFSFDKIGLVGKLIEGEEDSGKTDQQWEWQSVARDGRIYP